MGVALAVAAAAGLLVAEGRPAWCACGRPFPWSGDVWSPHNSQHLADPYSFSHVLHGFLFFWVLARVLPRTAPGWRFFLAIAAEAAWEVLENSAFVIERYREATAAVGYEGDAVANSLADILFCGIGYGIARRLGWRRTLALFVLTEVAMIAWIRDSLILNVIMLLFPIDAIRTWQTG